MPGTTNDAGIIVSPDDRQHIAIFGKASRCDVTSEAERDIAAITRKVYRLSAAAK